MVYKFTITASITLSKIKEGYNIYCVVREVEKGHLIGDIGGIDMHIPAFELSDGESVPRMFISLCIEW